MGEDEAMAKEIFISHSSKDAKISNTICRALEDRGLSCWIAPRDIGPGENFQESIVRAIRAAKIMVLIFSANANDSAEVKKELVLASQHKLAVIPVRIEDVVPGEAFAYELSTRQWQSRTFARELTWWTAPLRSVDLRRFSSPHSARLRSSSRSSASTA